MILSKRKEAPLVINHRIFSSQSSIYRYAAARSRIRVWLKRNKTIRIEGYLIGFDKQTNILLDKVVVCKLRKFVIVNKHALDCPRITKHVEVVRRFSQVMLESRVIAFIKKL